MANRKRIDIKTRSEKIIPKEKSNAGEVIKNIISFITLLLGIALYLLYIRNAKDSIDYMYNIINATALLIILVVLFLAFTTKKGTKTFFSTLTSTLVIGIIVFNVLVTTDAVTLTKNKIMKDFSNVSLVKLMDWSSKNKIEISQTCENSDNVEEGNIISQNVYPGTLLSSIKKVEIIVSCGPNYEKEVMLPSMIDWDIEDVLKFIEENHLINVIIDYKINNEFEKDKLISQNEKGTIKRNTDLILMFSLGKKGDLLPIEIDDLTKKSLFNTTVYLKKNGIEYEIKYEYNSKLPKGTIISQSVNSGSKVDPTNDKVIIVVSKGKEIIVPNFKGKTVDDVVKWATDNKLKISFNEKYDPNIENGKLIDINLKAGSTVSEGDKIIISISKGALTFPGFTSISQFKTWADMYGIPYKQTYEYNEKIAKGKIIKFSISKGAKVSSSMNEIVVYISNGKPIVVPNFVGKAKSTITSECNKLGLSCTFTYSGYSSVKKDNAVSQNVKAGNKVVSGTYVSITLSPGPAKNYTVYIQIDTWKGNTGSQTKANLLSKLKSLAPGVTFEILVKKHTSAPSGLIHPSSPIKAGNNTFTQGKKYTIWVVE